MSRNAAFNNSRIILLDAWDFEPDSKSTSVHNPGASNADTSRIIRRIYPQDSYAKLADESVQQWRGCWGENGRFVEQRLLFAGEGSSIMSPQRPHETVNYVKDSYDTSCKVTPGGPESLEIWNSLETIRAKLRSAPDQSESMCSAQETQQEKTLRGFVSDDCGWANAGATMEWLRQEVIRMGRVECRVGEVQHLLYSDDGTRVAGVQLRDSTRIWSDLAIVAAGCHSSRILGVPEMCTVESAVVAYIQLSDAESEELKRRDWPMIINIHRGVFCVGPDHDNCLKLGHCSTGSKTEILRTAGHAIDPRPCSSDPTYQPRWENPAVGWGGDVPISSQGDVVGPEIDSMNKNLAAFRSFLLELLGPEDFGGIGSLKPHDSLLNKIAIRPFARVRQCWYNDTPTYDFIVDYHPSYDKSLFVASGGCDHAFKFLPVLGERVVSIIFHRLGVSELSKATGSSIEELCELWKFPVHNIR
ncbi:hypothetical protein N7527_003105 [Penicillium freii]|nr:hypothetical protein N7527_003105 [Penicillium freii]